jgi:hypothetical protein
MRLSASRPILAGVIAILTTVGFCGCSLGTEGPLPIKPISKEEADTRSEVPLTRMIRLGQPDERVSVEFELPPPGPNAASALMIGLRTSSPDVETGITLSDKIVRGGLAAKVRLLRLDEGSVAVVPLTRTTHNLSEWVAVPADGSVPGVTMTSVDPSLLQEAGLVDAELFQQEYKFAVAERIQLGHYQLTVELLGEHPELQREEAELLVAYFARGK